MFAQRRCSDAALPLHGYKHPLYSVFFRPGSRNSQNSVGSLSQKVMKRGEIVQWWTLTLNALVLQGAASPVFPSSDGTSRYCWRDELDSSAPLRPSAAFVPMVSDDGDSAGNKRLVFLLSKRFAVVKVCAPVSAATSRSVEGFLFSPTLLQSAKTRNGKKGPGSCFFLGFFFLCFSPFKAPASGTGSGVASQEHSFLQMPFRLISQFINSTFSVRVFDYPVK